MTTITKIKLEFGVPKHGWLPIRLKYLDFVLDLDISDVPMDPMVQLCNALIQIIKGIPTPERIIWHLEPYTYYLQLEKNGDAYKAIILESDNFNGPAKQTKVIEGNFEAIILPLYRALKKFCANSYESPHWDSCHQERLQILTALIKQRK